MTSATVKSTTTHPESLTPAQAPARVVIPCAADWRRAEERARAICPGDVRPVQTARDFYVEVRSQSSNRWYTVRPERGGWSCDCKANAHGLPCDHIAAAQPYCLNCRTDRSVVNGDYCAGCAHVIADRVPAPAAPIPFSTQRLHSAVVASIADSWQVARDRQALEDAAAHRPLRAGHGWN